jgi:hypothetical protein
MTENVNRSWQSVDLEAVVSGEWKPPKPSVGGRRDGIGLFYPGKMHTVASESEAGKTWFVIAAAFDELRKGSSVLYIDFEDDENAIVGRLLTFQAQPEWIRERFHYKRPTESVNTVVNLADLMETIETHTPTLAVIDGITEAMAMHGHDPNKNDDIALFAAMLPRKIADTGCATVCLDHVVKAPDSRGRYALGGVHKLNGLDGAAYILENIDPFGVGITGRSTILIAKDRPGQLRVNGLRRKDGLYSFGELAIESHDAGYAEFEIKPAVERTGEFRPTIVMTKISALLQERGPLSQRMIIDLVGGKSATVRHALALLRIEGYVTEKTPHASVRPYVGEGETP